MADFPITDSQNVDLTLAVADAAGNPVTGDVLDAGSVTAVFADGTEWTVTVSADQTTVNARANGALTVGDVLTVNGSLNGTALTPATMTFDVTTGVATTIGLSTGTPVAN